MQNRTRQPARPAGGDGPLSVRRRARGQGSGRSPSRYMPHARKRVKGSVWQCVLARSVGGPGADVAASPTSPRRQPPTSGSDRPQRAPAAGTAQRHRPGQDRGDRAALIAGFHAMPLLRGAPAVRRRTSRVRACAMPRPLQWPKEHVQTTTRKRQHGNVQRGTSAARCAANLGRRRVLALQSQPLAAVTPLRCTLRSCSRGRSGGAGAHPHGRCSRRRC